MLKSSKTNDVFLVYLDETLIADYQTSLFKLYQPFIGGFGIALYQTLMQYAQVHEPITFHRLLIDLNSDFDVLPDTFARLEAAQLVTTYQGEIDGFPAFLYQVNSPLTTFEFLKDPLLVRVLTSFIGDDRVAFIRADEAEKAAHLSQLKHVKNVSHLMKDVYKQELTVDPALTISATTAAKSPITQPVPEPVGKVFDFNSFLIFLPTSIRTSYDFNQPMKKLLARLVSMYEFTEAEMAQIFTQTVHKGDVTEQSIRQEAYNHMVKTLHEDNLRDEFEHNQSLKKAPQPHRESATAELEQIKNPQVQQTLAQLKQMATQDYVKMLTDSITPADYQLIDRLLFDYHLPHEVANVLLNYSYRGKNTLSPRFVEAVAQSWTKQKITTAEEAFLFLQETTRKQRLAKEEKATRPYQSNLARRTEQVADFETEKVDLTPEEIQKLLEGLE